MLIEGCEDGAIWWEWGEHNFPTRSDSAVNATFHSIVPESQQFYLARATYSSLSGADVVLCGDKKSDDDRKSSGRVDASLSANVETDGSGHADFEINLQTRTDSGIEIEIRGSAGVRQDRDGNVQGNAGGRVSVGSEF